MRTGYSLLLGEYIDAGGLEYRDCEPFQVVCPECFEPVFKARRGELDYLSHYRRDAAYDEDCELRAAQSSKAEEEKRNRQSRDQRLEFFLGVFKRALEMDSHMRYNRSLEHSHRQLRRNKPLAFFRDRHFEAARGGLAAPEVFTDAAQLYISDVEAYGSFPKTGFSTTTQTRIANDLFRHLTTPQGRSNYDALFFHAVLVLMGRLATPDPNENEEGRRVGETVAFFLDGLISTGKREGFALLQRMMNTPIYPPFVEEPTTYVVRVASDITHEMVGTLLRLPYFSLLKQFRPGPKEGQPSSGGQ